MSPSPSSKFVALDSINPATRLVPQPKFVPLDDAQGKAISAATAITTRDTIDNAADLAPLAGGAVGSMLGPGGSMVGAGIGGLAARGLHRAYNGETKPDSLSGMTTDFGMNAALQGVGEALPFIGKDVGELVHSSGSKIAQLLFKGGGKVNAEGAKAALELGLEPSISQQTDSPIARMLENVFAAKNKIAKEIEQTGKLRIGQGQISDALNEQPTIGPKNSGTTQSQGALAQGAIQSNLDIADAVTKKAYSDFENTHLGPNTHTMNVVVDHAPSKVMDADGKPTMLPVTKPTPIVGPISTLNATEFAGKIKGDLDNFTKGYNYQALPDDQQKKVKVLQGLVNDLTEGTHVLGPDDKEVALPLKDYKSLKQTITFLNSDVGGIVNPNLQQGGLQKLSELLDKDMDAGVQDWSNGKTAFADLEKAKAANRWKMQTFNDEITSKIYASGDKRIPADASQAFNQSYNSPEEAQRFKTAIGPANEKYWKANYWDNVVGPKLWDSASGKFTPENLINDLENPNSVSRQVFNSEERNGMLSFARAAQNVAPNDSALGKYALSIANGRMLIHLGAASAGALIGGKSGGVASAAEGALTGLTLELGAGSFAKNILLNPSNARSAARLLKVGTDTTEGISRTKLMLRTLGMGGAQVLVNRNDGSAPQSGTVTEGGKVKLEGN